MPSRRAGRLSRRELFAGALAAGAAGVVSVPGQARADSTSSATGAVSEASLLTAALVYEHLEIFSIRHVLKSPVAKPVAVRDLLRTLLAQDRAHARVLTRELTGLGAALPALPTRPEQVNQALSNHNMSGDLTALTTLKEAIQYLLNVGALTEGAYFTAIGGLKATGPLVRATQALASEGQHQALLNGLIYPGKIKQEVPAWYVSGVT